MELWNRLAAMGGKGMLGQRSEVGMMLETSRSKTVRILCMAVLCCFATIVRAQQPQTVINLPDTLRPTQYIPEVNVEQRIDLFQGFSLSVDIFGPILYAMSDQGFAEAALRLNLKNQYFPVFEAGFAKCDKTDDNTDIHYSTSAPYLRAGFDINVLKDKLQDNRLFVGARYGFSSFNYDISGPDQTDPIWGGTHPFRHDGLTSTCHWLEFVFSVQVKIWRSFHMGWSIRHKKEMKFGKPDIAKPSYVPGYGFTTTGSCWSGTYSLIFDLNWGKRERHINVDMK